MKAKYWEVLGTLAFLFAILVTAIPAAAQLDRWNDLTQRAGQLAAQGRFADALLVAKEALSVAESTFGKTHVNYGMSQNGLGYVLMQMGNLDEAEVQFVSATHTIETGAGPENVALLYSLGNLAQLYYIRATASQANSTLMQQHLAQAEHYGNAALAVAEKNFGKDDIKIATFLEGLAPYYVADKHFSDAQGVLQRSLGIEKSNLPADHVQIIRTENEMGWVSEQMGNKNDAQRMYQTALASAEKTLGVKDPLTTSIRESLGRLSSGGSTAGSEAQGDFLATLKQVMEGSGNHFAALKGARQEDSDGDHLWTPTVTLPRAGSCTIWNYHERGLGSSYVCKYKSYPSEAAAVQDYMNMKQTVAQFLGPQWTTRETSSNDKQVRFSNAPYGVIVRLRLYSCNHNDCTLAVWVDADK
jgi:hypothetical protein